jgi:hypothetical protein
MVVNALWNPAEGYRPVISDATDGSVHGAWAVHDENATPLAASESSVGLVPRRYPAKPRWSDRRESTTNNKMFGGRAAHPQPRIPLQRRAKRELALTIEPPR